MTLPGHPALLSFRMVNPSAHLSAFRPLEGAGPCLTSRLHGPDALTLRNKGLSRTYMNKARRDGRREKRAAHCSPGSSLSQLESQYIRCFHCLLPENLSQCRSTWFCRLSYSPRLCCSRTSYRGLSCKVTLPQGARYAPKHQEPPGNHTSRPRLECRGFQKRAPHRRTRFQLASLCCAEHRPLRQGRVREMLRVGCLLLNGLLFRYRGL